MPSPVSGVGGTTAIHATKAAQQVDRSDQMGKDMFLKLLVAQMKYQDPANPASSSEFMAQTATFTQVEKLEEIAAQNAAMLVLQEHSTAGAMVGRNVTYTDSSGEAITGKVSSVRLASASDEAVAVVNGVEVPVGRITVISQSGS